MALLKAAIPTFLTHHRNLTELLCVARRSPRSRRYSEAAGHGPRSSAARRRVSRRLSLAAAQNKGIWRQVGLELSKLIPCDLLGVVPDEHGRGRRAHGGPIGRPGRAPAAAAERACAATGRAQPAGEGASACSSAGGVRGARWAAAGGRAVVARPADSAFGGGTDLGARGGARDCDR